MDFLLSYYSGLKFEMHEFEVSLATTISIQLQFIFFQRFPKFVT